MNFYISSVLLAAIAIVFPMQNVVSAQGLYGQGEGTASDAMKGHIENIDDIRLQNLLIEDMKRRVAILEDDVTTNLNDLIANLDMVVDTSQMDKIKAQNKAKAKGAGR